MTQKIRLSLPKWSVENVILLNVRLNERVLVRMLLDTGAKYTLITPEVAKRLGLDLASGHQVPVATATRVEKVVVTNVAQVDVQGLVLSDVETGIIPLPAGLGVDGLLGMSFLKHCRMVLDMPNRILELDMI
jgi:clan AA aspartic protease (TIGR02281 family)